MRCEGRSFFVTGAASGIGRAAAGLVAREGGAVACADLDAGPLAELVEGLVKDGARAVALPCNVADSAGVRAAVERAAGELGGLHAVFNVAGTGALEHTERVSEEAWNRILAVNLTGTFLVSQAALPHLLRHRKSAIVNVSSVAGLNGQAYSAAYCASKAGVVGLTKALAVEYVKRGLRVNCVCPAGVTTPLVRHFAMPEGADPELMARLGLVAKMTKPEEVAEAMVYLASEASRSINGVALPLDFGNTAA